MNILLTLSAMPLAIAAVPAAASDCTTVSAAKPAANEAVVREMLAYSLQGQLDDAEDDCRSATRPVDCVDCPEAQKRQQQA